MSNRTIVVPPSAQGLYDRFPSWTAVGVTQLARAEYLVEIRAVAVVGSALS